MSRFAPAGPARPLLLLAGVLGLLTTLAAGPPICVAAGRDSDRSVSEYLAAGEFSTALGIARQIDSPPSRDAALERVARAQLASGARDAALATAALISSDRARYRILKAVGDQPLGAAGGENEADFDALMDLITTTVDPQSWDDGGGEGTLKEFAGGVYVDAEGELRRAITHEDTGDLDRLLRDAQGLKKRTGVRATSRMRKVSLTRLEKHVQLRLAAGRQPTEAMRVLAGLQRIKHVFIYPETGDIVLAGPASDWRADGEGRQLGVDSGAPVLLLDDLVVVLRHMTGERNARFGCSITPTKASLAKAKAFLVESSKTRLKPGGRDAWLAKLRNRLGAQTIDVYGIDPRTHAGHVMIEADYRMKLVGMGLEEGVLGVRSYLASIPGGKVPPPMDVLRWWFTLNYDAVRATPDRRAFEFRGQGAQVLSENEFIKATGERVHTGKSDVLNSEFARSFTKNFPALAAKYPVYAELRNLFDMALVGALLKSENLSEKTGWHLTCFGAKGGYQPSLGHAPKTVQTVINHRVIKDKSSKLVHVVAGVSGGVRVDPWKYATGRAVSVDKYGRLQAEHSASKPKKLVAWWWDRYWRAG